MAEQNENLQQNTIIFRMGDETGIVIEKTQEQFEHSLFKEQYKQAFSIMDSIISRTTKGEIDENISNIIAFCGDRGEGKTSALETIRGILLHKDRFKAAVSAQLFDQATQLDANKFKVLNLVDPAFFDKEHNLIELLLGQMYAEILCDDNQKAQNGECEDFCASRNVAFRNQLMQSFEDVRHSLDIIHKASEKNAYDNLEQVDDLAAGIVLKKKICYLLKTYAKYFQKERVLICIDDLDLNVSEGYQMAEEIRKYLSLPSACIVMMAIKVEQMVEVVQSYLRDKMSKEIIPNDTITDMANRYVTKMLPQNNRVMMPTGESIVERPLQILNIGVNDPFESIKDAVVQLIYRKTRYIFVNGRNLSPIVPTNLRSVRHLIGLLCNMPNVDNTSGYEIYHNQIVFKNYFYHTWVRNLDSDDAKFVTELVQNEDLVATNKSIILYLRKKLLSVINDNKYKFDGILAALLDPLNTVQNVSLGDAYYVLKYLDDIATSQDDKNLVFFLRAFYSILLYDTYNFVSESEEHLFVDEEDQKPSIYKYDEELRHLNKLQRLINGSYFTYELGSFMPTERSIPREKRIINGDTLNFLLKSLKDIDKKEDRDRILKICEFFVLTTCYPAYSLQSVEYNKKMSARSYYAQFTTSNHYMIFDVLSIFYNLINVKFTYQRWNKVFGGDFYTYAMDEQNDSLLRKILDTCDFEHPTPESALDSQLHSLISEVVIRFSEVQLAILDYLYNHRDTNKEGGNANNIRIVYSTIQRIGIKLYPLIENGDRHELKFYFLSPIIDLLDEADEYTFDDIYTISRGLEESIESINSSLDEIFKNSLAKKGVKYPKNKTQILNKLYSSDSKLVRANLSLWDEIISDNVQYDSWPSLRAELGRHIDRIREVYENIK